VLDGVTVTVPAGCITALVGPSGAGKTSLLRLLNRLDDPAAGTIMFAGAPIAAVPIRTLRQRVGFVFQTPVMFPGTVADNLRVAATLAGYPSPGEAELEETAGRVGLDPSYLARDGDRLSGGERQRANIARALMTRPETLLMDEPTSALDPEVAERLIATVRDLARTGGVTIVMVTHRLSEARTASDYIIMLESGRVVETGSTQALFTGAREARTRAYLAAGA